jgi:hypothetical protein
MLFSNIFYGHFLLLVTVSSFTIFPNVRKVIRSKLQSNEQQQDVDGQDFESVVQAVSESISKGFKVVSNDRSNENRNENPLREEIYREYPEEFRSLPVLSDCNNYYSGSLGDNFW